MFGFLKKKQSTEEKKEGISSLAVETIPAPFYGGGDPSIYSKEEKPRPLAPARPPEKTKGVPQKPVVPKPVGERSSSRRWFFIGAAVLGIGVFGIVWYYLVEAGVIGKTAPKPSENTAPSSAIPASPISEIAPPVEEIAAIPPQIETVPEENPTSIQGDLLFPNRLGAESADSDADELTDIEEELFGTDNSAWDTDGDGYYDGQEVFNLYNPQGTAPIRLIESGAVAEYLHPQLGYQLFYPKGWEVGTVDAKGEQLLLSSITGDFIEVRAMPNTFGTLFVPWFSLNAKDQLFSDLVPFVNRFGISGYWRSDRLVAYIPDGEMVYVVLYHPGPLDTIPFRHVLEMVAQSFRGAGAATIESLPIPLENETAEATSTSDVSGDTAETAL